MTTIQRIRLSDLAARLGCELHGDPELEITGVAGLEEAGPSEVRQALRRKDGLLAVALACQTDHQPIANQVVIADALDAGEILKASGADRYSARAQQRESNRDRQKLLHKNLNRQNAH
jgi:hypothetical protein